MLLLVGCSLTSYNSETFWQYADSGSNPGDQDIFNGTPTGLKKYVLSLLSKEAALISLTIGWPLAECRWHRDNEKGYHVHIGPICRFLRLLVLLDHANIHSCNVHPNCCLW
jgi:hypothetical protein